MRYVTLGDGSTIGVNCYVAGWQEVISSPPERLYKKGLTGWWPVTAQEILRQYRAGLHDRISRRAPGYGCGRKWDSDWQRNVIMLATKVNARCVVRANDVPKEFRRRLAARIYDES